MRETPARFGIPRLDDYLGGGIDRDSIGLIVGYSGTGKTVLASQWAAEGAKNDEIVIYLSTTLTKKSCETYLRKFRFMEDVYDRIHWRFIRIEPKYIMPVTREKVKEGLAQTLKLNPQDIDRIIFDSCTDLDKALADPVLYRRAIRYMADFAYEYDITALFVEEAPMLGEWSETRNLVEAIIWMDFLRVPDGFARAMRIVKKYRTKHPLNWFPYEITEDGIVIKDGWYVGRSYEYEYRPHREDTGSA